MQNTFYKKVNLNPKGSITGDCVVRAIANALDKDWYQVFDDLTKIARDRCGVIDEPETYSIYLKDYPTIRVKFVDKYGENRRLRPRYFKEKGLNGTYIVSVAGHLTCVRNGVVEDTWNCANKCAYKIWEIKNKE